jgi:hypothetical protein
VTHGGLLLSHVSEYSESEDEKEAYEEPAEGLAHDGFSDTEEESQDDGRSYEVG